MGQHSETDVSALMEALEERWVLTLATTTPDGLPYATPLFCALAALPDVDAPMLVFASRPDSCHGRTLAEGAVTIMYALEHRRELSQRWGWLLTAGVMDIIIAGVIIVGLPGSAAWAIGLLVGLNMIFGGTTLIGMSLAMRNAR